MAHGKTLELRWVGVVRSKPLEDYTTPRDRSLNGKKRVKARKIKNKEA